MNSETQEQGKNSFDLILHKWWDFDKERLPSSGENTPGVCKIICENFILKYVYGEDKMCVSRGNINILDFGQNVSVCYGIFLKIFSWLVSWVSFNRFVKSPESCIVDDEYICVNGALMEGFWQGKVEVLRDKRLSFASFPLQLYAEWTRIKPVLTSCQEGNKGPELQ
jgi:hypothetical protein